MAIPVRVHINLIAVLGSTAGLRAILREEAMEVTLPLRMTMHPTTSLHQAIPLHPLSRIGQAMLLRLLILTRDITKVPFQSFYLFG